MSSSVKINNTYPLSPSDMKIEIQKWLVFIKNTIGIEAELLEFVLDKEHKHKYKLGMWHIYSFWDNHSHRALKIGIAGPNSAARFSSQHYNENSAKSNLAKSLIERDGCIENPKQWILENTYRINAIFQNFDKPMAHALEAHLHLLYQPKFEK